MKNMKKWFDRNPFVKYRKFATWWASELSKRKNRLIDLSIRAPMQLGKRVLIEVPKVDDLREFIVGEGLDILIKVEGESVMCRLNGYSKTGTAYNIVRKADSINNGMKLAVLDYLKDSFVLGE